MSKMSKLLPDVFSESGDAPCFRLPVKNSSKTHLQTQIQLSLDIFHPRPGAR